MAMLPCILCGEQIKARFGSNTIYHLGTTYACCNAGCGRPTGAYDTSYVQAKIDALSDDERERSEVPPEDRL